MVLITLIADETTAVASSKGGLAMYERKVDSVLTMAFQDDKPIVVIEASVLYTVKKVVVPNIVVRSTAVRFELTTAVAEEAGYQRSEERSEPATFPQIDGKI